MSLNHLFNAANFFVLPFWTLMVLLPKWSITQRVMESRIPYVVLALLYVYLFAGSLDSSSAQDFANLQLADVARLFSTEKVAATGWVHYLVMDLFVGRWIYLEGRRTGVWTIHSLLLCFFAGPMGLLSHILTTWGSQKFLGKKEQEPLAQA